MTNEEAIAQLESLLAVAAEDGFTKMAESVQMAIESLKADRPKGKWIGSECSVCHDDLMNYQYELPSIECGFCPFCGADMRGEP